MKQKEKNTQNIFRTKFIFGAVIIAVICAAVLAAILIMDGVKQNKYVSAIQKGNHYFTAGDYQNAIVEYETALEIDQKKDTAYLNLASVYTVMGNYEVAKTTIGRGLQVVITDKLKEKEAEIDYLIAQADEQKNSSLTKDELKQYAKEVVIENNFLDMVSGYSYTEYYRDFGAVTPQQDGQKLILNYPEEGFYTVYYDLEKEKVVDGKTGMPYANVKPCEVSFYSIRKIFASGSETFAVSYERLKELFSTSLKFYKDEQENRYYISAEYKGCRISVETDSEGNIIKDTAWNKIEPLTRGKFESEDGIEGEVKGYVQDATTGRGIKSVMKVRQRGKKTGTPVMELTSNADGSYTYGGKQGSYTIEVGAKGYITEYFDVEILRGQVKTGKNVVLSPEVKEGEIRIVLTWGSKPADLDSYAIGKTSGGQNFNINFTNPKINNVGNLDVDDISSFGPETITITDVGAEFTYSVVDFRAEGTMANSSAKVKVYLPGNASAVEFNIPSGEGLLWNVFKYENGEVKKINQLTSDVNRSKFYIGGR